MIFRHIKNGFIDGFRSLRIDLDPPRRKNVIAKGGIQSHWKAVGYYLNQSMRELEKATEYRDKKYDAHYLNKNEQKKEESLGSI